MIGFEAGEEEAVSLTKCEWAGAQARAVLRLQGAAAAYARRHEAGHSQDPGSVGCERTHSSFSSY